MRPTTTINGVEYALDTTLRVAYLAQGANNHKPYSEVFQSMGEMPLEKQIELLYLSFKIANPEEAKMYSFQAFLNYYLDNFDLGVVMDQLEKVIKGVLGEGDTEETDQGN